MSFAATADIEVAAVDSVSDMHSAATVPDGFPSNSAQGVYSVAAAVDNSVQVANPAAVDAVGSV